MKDPYANQPLLMAGTSLASAKTAAVLIHGRGADAASIHETADTLRALGAQVDERIYPGMAHTVNDDEVAWLRETLRRLAPSTTKTSSVESHS